MTTVLSVISLIVAVLALPISYLVARSQVRLGFVEQDRRAKARQCSVVADRLGEFWQILYGAVREIVGIEPDSLQGKLDAISSHAREVDAFVTRSQVMLRLVRSIDGLDDFGWANLTQDVCDALKSIRFQAIADASPLSE